MANRGTVFGATAAMAALLAMVLFAAPTTPPVKHFHKVSKKLFPRSVLEELCSDAESIKECFESFQEIGEVWAGDVNDDGVDELLVFPGGGWVGSAGEWYMLFQQQNEKWIPLYPNQGGSGWQVNEPRFDILPVMHDGYHDLRIAPDWCLKWDGEHYVDYEASDYHKLSPSYFNASNWHEAEIFWANHYRGLDEARVRPQWFPIPRDFTPPMGLTVDDPEHGVFWLAQFKGGVWGVDEGRAFLLLPHGPYRGAAKLELDGDWLVIYAEPEELSAPPPMFARYNRKTHVLRMEK